jgi:hypothetical protein
MSEVGAGRVGVRGGREVEMVWWGAIAGVAMSVVFFLPSVLFHGSPEALGVGEAVGYTAMVLAMTSTFFAMRAESGGRGRCRSGGASRSEQGSRRWRR